VISHPRSEARELGQFDVVGHIGSFDVLGERSAAP